jgi:hypothetical protein
MRSRVKPLTISKSLNNFLKDTPKQNENETKGRQSLNFYNFVNMNTIAPCEIKSQSNKKTIIHPEAEVDKIDIKPENFFSTTKMKMINNIRDIFLEFDKDKSSKNKLILT